MSNDDNPSPSQIMINAVSALTLAIAAMEEHEIASPEARALFAAWDAYNARLEIERRRPSHFSFDAKAIPDLKRVLLDEDQPVPLERGPGAGAPQSEVQPGNMGLEYSEQNFNALVAANTAMQTALADNTEQMAAMSARIADKDLETTHLREVINDSLRPSIDALRKSNDAMETRMNRVEKDLVLEQAAHNHTRKLLIAADRRTERAKGYIDRIVDDEARTFSSDAKMIPAPAPRRPVGPRLNDITDPLPPQSARDGESGWRVMEGVARMHHEEDLPRNY